MTEQQTTSDAAPDDDAWEWAGADLAPAGSYRPEDEPMTERETRNAALEEAARACEDLEQAFLSPQYKVRQPLSSFHERFACRKCAAAIRAMKEPPA